MEVGMNTSGARQKRPQVVLVAEDDSELRELLSVELELEGLSVLTARDGAEVVSTARRQDPDVILMDLLMPVQDGVEATRALKTTEETKHIPVLLITAVENKDKVVEGLNAGAIDYVTTPLFLPELKARLRSILRFKMLCDEIKSIQEHFLKDDRVDIARRLSSLMQQLIDNKLTIIFNKIDIIRRKGGSATPEDLHALEKAARAIEDSTPNLSFFECFPPGVPADVSRILDFTFLN
jgi:CheY-like chemotaxis protein